MDDGLEEAFDGIAEAIRGLQAGQIAQARVLRALIASHPDPDAMRAAWLAFSSVSASDAATSKVLNPQRAAIHQANEEAIADWTRRVEQDLRRT
jgi:hypothetical protein